MGLEFFEPQTLEEAIALGGRWGERGKFIAGGTDLVIQMRRGRKDPAALISLLRLQELQGISLSGSRITLGALTTHREIERHPAFQGALFAMVEGAQVIGGHQVRNAGTVAGNLCNASPAADLLPVLLVLDADVHLRGLQGERDMPIAGFLQGPGLTARAPGELLTGVSFRHDRGAVIAGLIRNPDGVRSDAAWMPGQARHDVGVIDSRFDQSVARSGTSFLKFGRRRAMEISIVSVAASVTLDTDGRWLSARVAVGAAAPTAIRIPAAEAMLKGVVEPQHLAQAGREAAAVVSPLDDVRASAAYRRHLVETLVPRALAIAHERALKS